MGCEEWPVDSDRDLRWTFYRLFGTTYFSVGTFDQGVRSFVKAVVLGDAVAASVLAAIFAKGDVNSDIKKHVYWLEKAAEMGLADDALVLVKLYTESSQVEANPRLARKWMKHAARLGNQEAQTMLNTCSALDCDKVDAIGKQFKRCSGCKMALYCSTECQRNHWQNGHKENCKPKHAAAKESKDGKSKANAVPVKPETKSSNDTVRVD